MTFCVKKLTLNNPLSLPYPELVGDPYRWLLIAATTRLPAPRGNAKSTNRAKRSDPALSRISRTTIHIAIRSPTCTRFGRTRTASAAATPPSDAPVRDPVRHPHAASPHSAAAGTSLIGDIDE